MKRKIIKIDEEKCNGCGLCADACHEGAIGMKNGKAKLLRDDYCDGLGDCLPVCPTGAITFEEREAAAYDEEAVKKNMAEKNKPLPCGCPGTHVKSFDRENPSKASHPSHNSASNAHPHEGSESCHDGGCCSSEGTKSELLQWPVQIKLVPVNAPYFQDANLLVAADCTAFAYGDFHKRFIRNHITLIGCPKLDMGDYTEKLTAILTNNDIKSLKIVRMEVPCCGGIEEAAKQALKASGKFIPWQVVVVATDGRIISE